MKYHLSGKGFTLPEVLIVLAIIAILTSFAIPVFEGFSDDGKIEELKADLMKIAASQENYYSVRGTYATKLEDLESFGYSPADNAKKNFFTGVRIDKDLGMQYWVAGNYDLSSGSGSYAECWIYLGENLKTGEQDPFVRLYNEAKNESKVLTCNFCPDLDDVCKRSE